MKKGFIIIANSILFLYACQQPTKTNELPEGPKEEIGLIKFKVPVFNDDQAFQFIKDQVNFGPRVPNTPAHLKCQKYFIDFFKGNRLIVTEQHFQAKAFNGTMLNGNNITASINPKASNRIFISAHWDTRPFADQDTKNINTPIDGANDGGSGVAVIMQLAQTLVKDTTIKLGVDFILWDLEDYGQNAQYNKPYVEDSYCLGSQYWAKNKAAAYQPKYGINLDMIGAPGATFFKDGISIQFAYGVVEKMWNAAKTAGYANYFVNKSTPASLTDDHKYINTIAKIPCIDIIHHDEATPSNFPITWHTHNDNVNAIDKNSLRAVGQSLLQLIYEENNQIK